LLSLISQGWLLVLKVCKFKIFSNLMISHYTAIKTMFMYFCVWFSWPWGWLHM